MNWFDLKMQELVDSGICRRLTDDEMAEVVKPLVDQLQAEIDQRVIEELTRHG